jgi:hypothetical protein
MSWLKLIDSGGLLRSWLELFDFFQLPSTSAITPQWTTFCHLQPGPPQKTTFHQLQPRTPQKTHAEVDRSWLPKEVWAGQLTLQQTTFHQLQSSQDLSSCPPSINSNQELVGADRRWFAVDVLTEVDRQCSAEEVWAGVAGLKLMEGGCLWRSWLKFMEDG